MSIIGIDLGNMFTKAATLEKGSIDALLFNGSSRMNNTFITFKEKRLIGINSYNIFKNNMNSSLYGFNKLIHDLFLDNYSDDQNIENNNSDLEIYMPIKNINDQNYYLHHIYFSYLELCLKSLGKTFNDFVIISTPSYFNISDVKFAEDSLYLSNVNNSSVLLTN